MRRKFLTAMANTYIGLLGLSNSNKTVLIVVESLDYEFEGTTVNVDPLHAYIVALKPGSLRTLASALAHEMIHVRQMARGYLQPLSGGRNKWMGKVYRAKMPYLDRPWEIAAFSGQELLMRRAFETAE